MCVFHKDYWILSKDLEIDNIGFLYCFNFVSKYVTANMIITLTLLGMFALGVGKRGTEGEKKRERD